MKIKHLLVLSFTMMLALASLNVNAQTPDGSSAKPYPIKNLEALNALRDCMNGSAPMFYFHVTDSMFVASQGEPATDYLPVNKTAAGICYKLLSDIDLNPGKNVAACDGDGTGLTEWVPIKNFYGNLDGDFHIISGVFINKPSVDSVGFISQVHGGNSSRISNLGIVNSYIAGKEKVGGLVGYIEEATVSHCFVDAVIVGMVQEIGGLAGFVSNVTIDNCYTTGSITCLGKGLLGGICGEGLNVVNMTSCYSSVVINHKSTLESLVGGIAGELPANSPPVTNCYYDKQMCVPLSNAVGTGLLTSEMLSQSTCQSLGSAFQFTENHYPSLTGFSGENPYVKLSTSPILLPAGQTMKDIQENFAVGGTGVSWVSTDENYAKVLSTNEVEVYKEGWLQLVSSMNGKTRAVAFYTHKAPFIGTEENPFPINNYTDLIAFRDGVNLDTLFMYNHFEVNTHAAGTWFRQTADISLAPVSNWIENERIGKSEAISFKGGYDGGGHKLTDLTIRHNSWWADYTYCGLFGVIDGGSVKNLNLYVSEFHPGRHSGPLCGKLSRNFTIENCHVFPSAEQVVLELDRYSGGIIGFTDAARGRISNCSNHCNVVSVSSSNYIGGIVGFNQNIDTLYISDCQNYGSMTGDIQYVAGITSQLAGGNDKAIAVIERCKNYADMYVINTWTNLAGILAYRNTDADKVKITISYCENYGDLTTTYRVAGIATASNLTSIHHCVNAGDLWVKDLNQREASNAYGITATTDVYSSLNTGKVTVDRGGNAYGITTYGSFDCFNAGELTAHSEGFRALPFNAWNGSSSTTARNINIGRVNGVATYWGSTNANRKNNNICDKQMIFDAHTAQGNNTMLRTSEMLGTSLQGSLGTENWVYSPGMYPRIKGLDTLPISIVTAMPVVFSSVNENSYDQINSVSSNFTVAGCDSVTWICKGNTTLSGCTATVSNANYVGVDTLVATYKGATKTVCFCRKVNVPAGELLVTSIEDLRTLRDGINSAAPFLYNNVLVPAGAKGTKFKQTHDISMSSPADDNWETIGKVDAQFYGEYNGDSHTISNLKQDSVLNGGLFGYAYNNKIHDVHMVDVKISKVRAAAGAVVAVTNNMQITNCTASGEVSGADIKVNASSGMQYNNVDNSIGGIVGNGYGDKIVSCVNYCNVTGYSKSSIGGIEGRGYYGDKNASQTKYIDSCANYGTINGNYCVGGLVGQQHAIRNSYNAGEVKGGADAYCVGGLAGHNACVQNSFNTGMVSAVTTNPDKDYSVGGLIGEVRNTKFTLIKNCYNAGIVDGTNRKYVGGIFGTTNKNDEYNGTNNGDSIQMYHTYVSNSVSGTGKHVGAIIGYNSVNPNNTRIYQNYYDTTFSYVGGINGVDVPGKATGLYTNQMVGVGLKDFLGEDNFTYGDTNYYPRLTGGSTPNWPATLASAAKLQLEKDETGAFELAKSVTMEQFTVGGCSDGVSWSQMNGNQIEFEPATCTAEIKGMGVLYVQSSHSDKDYKIIKLNVGNSAKNPLVIKDSLELVHFRDYINSGDTFYYDLQTKTYHATAATIANPANVFPIPNQGEGLFFKMTCEVVDFKGYDSWIPIGTKKNPFKGFFNGGGHTITRLNLTAAGDTVGFFGYLGRGLSDRGRIDSLYFTDVQLGGSGSIKGVVCAYSDEGIITGCRNDNATITHDGAGSNWGGICGYSHQGEVIGCSSTGCTISGANGSTVRNVGGVLGYGYKGAVSDCEVTNLTISNTKGVNNGGICGLVRDNTITGCQVEGSTLVFCHDNGGGICGNDSLSTINNCAFVNSSITDNDNSLQYLGGIIGYGYFATTATNLTIQGCHTEGNGSITASKSDKVGGIAGYLQGNYVSVSNCSNNIPVLGDEYVGGISGQSSCKTDSCYNTADVTGITYVGGLIGYGEGANTELRCSYNIGDIKAGKETSGDNEDPDNGDYVGGLIGKSLCYQILESFNSGIVKGTDYVGGLAGESAKLETNSYNAGQVYGSFFVGGIAGWKSVNADMSEYNYNIGFVDGNNINGALYGGVDNLEKVSNNYYDKQFSYSVGIGGEDVVGKAVGKLTSEMLNTSLALGDKWEYEEGMYPQVKALHAVPYSMKASAATAAPFHLQTDEVAWDITVGPLQGMSSDGIKWRTEGGSTVLTTTDNQEFQIHKVGKVNIETFDPATDSVYKRVHLMVQISEEHPIEIKDYTQLANFRDLINTGSVFYYDATNKIFYDANPNNAYVEIPPGGESMYFKLLVDVDLSTFSQANPWKPIGTKTKNADRSFKGHFNGNGKVIYNMVQTTKLNSPQYGFFGYSSGSIKNLTIANANVTASGNAAAVCGRNDGGSIINCAAIDGKIKGSDTYVGGVCGRSQDGTIQACYNSCEVNGTTWVGGIAGRIQNGVTIECYNMGRVTGSGWYKNNKYNYTQYAGGITGHNSSFLSDCYNTGIVSGENYVGGIAGLNEKESFTRVYNAGTVVITETPIGKSDTVGGLTNIKNVQTNTAHYPTNSATDVQMAPKVSAVNSLVRNDYVQVDLTAQMVADSLRSILGDEKWVYTDSLYPRLKVFATGTADDIAASIVSASPVYLQGSQSQDDVSSSFTTYNKNGVTWELAKPTHAVDTTNANYPKSGLVNINSCDLVTFKVYKETLIREVDLNVRSENTYIQYDTTCGEGYTWAFNSKFYSQSGSYSEPIDNGSNCNEKMNLVLLIPEPLSVTFTPGITCSSENPGSITASVTGGILKDNTHQYTYILKNEDDTVVVGSGAQIPVIDALQYGSYTLIIQDANNSKNCQVSQPVEIVNPDAVTVSDPVVTAPCYNVSNGIVSFDISGGVPPYGISWAGTTTTGSSSQSASGNFTLGGLANDTITFTITDGNGCTAQKEVRLTKSTQTYEIIAYGITKLYDGVAVSPDSVQVKVDGVASPWMKLDGNHQVIYQEMTFTVELSTQGTASLVNAGVTTNSINSVTVTKGGVDITCQLNLTTTDGAVVINKRNVVMTSRTKVVTSSGEGTIARDENVDVSGDGLAEGAAVSYTNWVSQVNVGSKRNTFDYTLTGADNYNITKIYGVLTVLLENQAIVYVDTISKVYDGSRLYATYNVAVPQDITVDIKVTDDGDFNDNLNNVAVEGLIMGPNTPVSVGFSGISIVDTGTKVLSVEIVRIYDVEHGQDLTTTYQAAGHLTTITGQLKITPRPVTLTSYSHSWEYDGTAHTYPTVTVSGEGFVDGEVSAIQASGSITTVGQVTNTIYYTENSSFNENNYAITKNEGTLEVTKRAATYTGDTLTEPYTGTQQCAPGITASGLVAGHTLDLDGVTHSACRIEPGTTVGTFTGTPKVMSGTTDVTDNYTLTAVPGRLTIQESASPLVIRSASANTDYYDGQVHKYQQYEVTYNGVAATLVGTAADGISKQYRLPVTGDTVTITPINDGANGIIHVGDPVVNDFSYSLQHGEYYSGTSVSIQKGTLSLKPREVTVVSRPAAKVYDGQRILRNEAYISGMGFVGNDGLNEFNNVPDKWSSMNNSNYVEAGDYLNRFEDGVLSDFNENTTPGDYLVTAQYGMLTIEKAILTVTADDTSHVYGSASPTPLTYTISGFVNDETEAGLRSMGKLQGHPVLTDTTTAASLVGSGYGISIKSASGEDSLQATNYIFQYESGRMSVIRRPIYIEPDPIGADGSITYDGLLHQVPADHHYSVKDGDANSGLLSTDVVVSVQIIGNARLAGHHTDVIKVVDVVVKRDDQIVTDCYQLFSVDTFIHIKAKPLKFIVSKNGTHPYDGQPHCEDALAEPKYVIDDDSCLVTYDAISYIAYAGGGTAYSSTHYPVYVDTSSLFITNSELNDASYNVKSCYEIFCDTGNIAITPNNSVISIESESAEFEYTGSAQQYPHYKVRYNGTLITDYTISGGDRIFTLPTGDKLTITPTAAITKPSENPVGNTFSYELEHADCYSGSPISTPGTLRVNDVPQRLEVSSGTQAYNFDNQSHQYPRYTVRFDNDDIVSDTAGLHVLIPATGQYVHITPTFGGITYDNDNAPSNNTFTYTITDSDDGEGTDLSGMYSDKVIIFGTVSINPGSMTATANTASKEYDGLPLCAGGSCTVEGATLWYSANNGLTWSTTAPCITTGTLTYKVKATKPGYSDAISNAATLTITPNAVVITVVPGTDSSKTYDGTPLTVTAPDDFIVTGVPEGFTWTAQADGTVTNVIPGAGEKAENAVSEFKIFKGDEDVTAQFSGVDKSAKTTLTITPATVTLRSGSKTREYNGVALTNAEVEGKNNNGLTEETGWVSGQGATYEFSGTITNVGTVKNAFTYTLKEGTLASNYTIVKTEGDLTVANNPASITVTSASAPGPITYDGQTHGDEYKTYTVTYNGAPLTAVEGSGGLRFALPTKDTLTVNPTFTGVTNVADVNDTLNNNVFTYTLQNADAYIGGKTVTYGTVNLARKALTITAKPQTYTYTGGAQGPAGIYSDGFDTYVTVGTLGTGDALASITLAGSQVNQGTYAGEIVPSNAEIKRGDDDVTDNYTITYNNADLTISKRDLTIKLDTTKVYDGTTFVSTLTSASNGNTNGYIVSGLQNNATVSGVVTSALKNVNTYRDSILPNEANITTEFTTSDNINNYNVVYDLKQVITPATLTITADNKTTKYGVVNHDFTYTPTGFVNGEDASVMSGTVTYTGNATTTTSSSIPGTYDITPVVSGLSAANYDFTAVNGALTIGKSDSAITISSPTHNWTYDGDAHSDHGYTVTYGGTTLTGVQEGDHYEYTISSTQDVITITPDPDAVVTGYTSSEVPNAFTYSIAHSDCYATPTVTTGKLTIGKATLTITADNKTTKYGVVNHDFTYTPTGFVNGEDASVMSGTVTYTGNAAQTGATSAPGDYIITPVVSGLSAANYDFTAVNGTLTITADNTHIAISSGSYNGVYDGQSHTAGYTVKYGTQNIDPDANSNGMVFTLPTNDKVTISHPTTITNVGSVSNKFTYVVNNAGYYSHIDTTCGLLKVTPLTVNISVPDTSIEYNGNLHHGKLVIASMFSNVVNGQIPQINYTPSQGTLADIYDNGHFDPSSFTVTGSSGNVTANYILGTLTPGKLTVADRANPYAVTVVSKSNTGNVYDGQSHSAAGFDTLRFSHDSHIYTVSGLSTADPSSINVCVLPNTITGTAVVKDADSNDVTAQFAVTLQPGTLEITRRHISASVANDTLEFNGQEQLSTKVPVFSNLVEGDMATVNYNPARGTQIGDYNNGEYIPGSLYVKNANGDTITDNYYLSASTTGKLNIAPPPLTVTAKDSTKTYDGTPLVATFTYEPTHTVPTIKYKVKNGETWSDYLTGESIPTITNAGSLTYLVEATANAYTVRDTATLTITKRNVTVTVDNAPDVEYTGANHHSDKEPVFHNVVAGQTPSITYHPAHGIVVGEYVGAYEAETFNVMSGATNLTGNYNLTTLTPGHLTIVNRTEKYTITVKANSDTTHIYDGTAYSAVSYDSIVHVGANGEHHFTVTGLTTTNPTSINTCEIPNVISGTPVVKDIHGHNVTDQFNVNLIDGLLRIKSRPITLRSRPGLKLYDSTALVLNTQSDVIVEGAGFVQGEGATYHITGSQRDVGISANEFTYTLNDGTLETNYDISTQFGTLTVKPDTFGLHIESRSENFVYDGQVHRRDEYRVVYKNVARDTIPGTNGLKFALPTKDTLTITPTFNGITHISQNADSNNTFTYTLQHSDWYEGKRDTVYGTVKILPREVIVHVNGKAKTVFYNGQSQSVTGYEVHFNDTLYNTSYFQYNGDSIATRLIVGQTMMGLHDTNFKHLPQYNDFSPVKFLVTDGFIWIVPDTSAAVVLAGRHSMVDYDGQEHSVHGYDIVSITPNYSADYFIFTGSSTDSAAERTTVGTTFMGLSDTMFRNVNPNFNDVTFKLQSDGYQQINRIEAAVKVVGHADTREYDGAEHVVTGYDLEFTPSFYTANSFTFNGHDTAKRTTEGTSWMGLAESQFVNTDTNFNQVTFTITDGKQVIKPNSTALTLQCPGNLSKPYDGTPLSSGATAYSTIPGDAFVIKYKSKLEGESVFSDWYDTVPSITNFGVKFVEVSCSNPNYLPQSCTYTLSISRRDVQLVSMDSLRIYNGDTLRYDSVKVTGSGFVNGEGATFAVTGNRLLPGSTPNTFTYSLKSNTLADNYQIGTTFGTLRVTERPDSLLYPITVVSNSNPVSTGDIIIYDGLKHTDSNFVTLTFTTEDGHPYTVTGLTAKVSAFDAGTYPNTIHGEPVVLDEYGNDVTDQFNIQLLEGQLVIRKHQVTITVPAEYATMMYNGDSLRVGYENVDISYLAARDTLSGGYFITEGYLEGTYHCSDGNFMATDMTGVASQHDFNIVHGASEEYEAGNSLANYRPSFDVVLTITKRPLEITASSAEKVYDGDPLTLAESDYTLTSGTTLAPTDTLFLTRTGSQACVGETANHITSVTILHKGDWVDVTSSYDITTVDGLLKVTRETDGLTCPPTLHITLTEDTYDTLVSQSLLGTANHALVHEGVATITHNLDEQNPMAAGTHTITWILYDTCQNAMDTCYQTVEVVYTPCEGVTYDGHFYNAERIGFQCWMTENLRNDEDEEGHYLVNCHAYKENQSNVEKFGYLYSWYSAMDVPENNDTASLTYFIGDNGRPYVEGICPDGWAVGNLQDYTALLATVGDSNPLKDAGDGYWYPGMGGTLPNSGFNARANGFYNSVSQRYEDLLTGSHFWMPETDTAAGTAANAVLQYYCSDGLFQQNPKGDLKGVRCIRKVAP